MKKKIIKFFNLLEIDFVGIQNQDGLTKVGHGAIVLDRNTRFLFGLHAKNRIEDAVDPS